MVDHKPRGIRSLNSPSTPNYQRIGCLWPLIISTVQSSEGAVLLSLVNIDFLESFEVPWKRCTAPHTWSCRGHLEDKPLTPLKAELGKTDLTWNIFSLPGLCYILSQPARWNLYPSAMFCCTKLHSSHLPPKCSAAASVYGIRDISFWWASIACWSLM